MPAAPVAESFTAAKTRGGYGDWFARPLKNREEAKQAKGATKRHLV